MNFLLLIWHSSHRAQLHVIITGFWNILSNFHLVIKTNSRIVVCFYFVLLDKTWNTQWVNAALLSCSSTHLNCAWTLRELPIELCSCRAEKQPSLVIFLLCRGTNSVNISELWWCGTCASELFWWGPWEWKREHEKALCTDNINLCFLSDELKQVVLLHRRGHRAELEAD